MKFQYTMVASLVAAVCTPGPALAGNWAESVVTSFGQNNSYPNESALVLAKDGYFYGTTLSGSTIYRLTPSGTLTTLHTFSGSDGQNTYYGLMLGRDGALYGTTTYGGAFSRGTVFRITTDGTFTKLHDFSASDGANPYGVLTQGSDKMLYGTTVNGGLGEGTVFRLSTKGKNFTTLHSFAITDGEGPEGGVIQASDGNFYGTTETGGTNGNNGSYGTLYQLTPSGGFTRLDSIDTYTDSPSGRPVEGADGLLYFYGSPHNGSMHGRIYRAAKDGSGFGTFYAFSGPDGDGGSQGDLIIGLDGAFYGVTSAGGAFGDGTAFRLDTGGALTTLHSFNFDQTDGFFPNASLVMTADGDLWSTTNNGGTGNFGTVFRIYPEPTLKIAVKPKTVQVNQQATLSWSSTNATTCTASGAWSGNEPLSGSQPVSEAATGSYPFTLTCTGPAGSAAGTATLKVK